MPPLKLVLTLQQIQAAVAVTQWRAPKYENDARNDMIGAIGEVAVGAWAAASGIQPVDEAFKDQSRDSGADLYLGPQKVSVDVKSSCDGEAYSYPERQTSTLKAKASAVIWCAVYPTTKGWEVIGYDVLILGWSSADDVLAAPLTSPQGRDACRTISPPVRDLANLISATR